MLDTPGFSTATPISDGKHVYVFYGTGVAACYDLEGNRRWIRFVQKADYHHGSRICPLLFDGKLVVCGSTIMFALNASDGHELWKTNCNMGMPSPALSHIGGEAVVVLPYGNVVRGSDGTLWVDRGGGGNIFTTPVIEDGVVYMTSGAPAGGARAMRLPNEAPKAAIHAEFIWNNPLHNSWYYFASPVVHDGLVYAISCAGELTVLDAKTGITVYERELLEPKYKSNSRFDSCLTLAGKYIYANCAGAANTTVVFEAGREYKESARNELDSFKSTPVFQGKRMYVRTMKYLYCIGE